MAAVVGVITALQPACAQDTERLTVEVDECVALEGPAERLECFEAQVEAARQERSAAGNGNERAARSAAPAAARPEPAAATVTAGRSSRDDRDVESQPAEMVAEVTELRETVPNAYVITLDNGQVWRQTQPMAYPLRPGSEVRIYRSRWGYRLTAEELRGHIQVERER